MSTPETSLRDYFAVNAASDEIQELTFKHLSRNAQETIAGRPYPPEPTPDGPLQMRISREQADAHAIAIAEFYMAVSAALRFRFADAMMAERERKVPD